MLKCPYCYEQLTEKPMRCPHCNQFIIDPLVNVDFPSIEKKDCLFCGKKILKEARFCSFCRKWLDEIDNTIEGIDWDDFA